MIERSESGTEITLRLWRGRIYFRRRSGECKNHQRYILEFAVNTRRGHRAYVDFRTGTLMCERCGPLATMHDMIDQESRNIEPYCSGGIRRWVLI